MPRGVEVIGFALIVLLIGLAVPVLMNSWVTTEKYYADIPENETQSLGGKVNVTVTEANLGDNSTIKVVDHETLETDTKTIPDGENATYRFSPGNVTVGVNETDSRGTRLYVELKPSYSWDEGARTIGAKITLVIAAMAVVVILVFIAYGPGGY